MEHSILRDRIINKALELGADDAGVCRASDLLSGRTHSMFPMPEGIEDHHSILVMALNHPPGKPELDYFFKKDGFRFGNSEGNRRLMAISERVAQWLDSQDIPSRDLHYYVERGGIFLKGAAALAGLGTIGVNNLLVHPGYGTRVRFRAHLVETEVAPSVPLDFDPCLDCAKPCLTACPELALNQREYIKDRCRDRFDRDYEEGVPLPAGDTGPVTREVHYCRECEFACCYKGSKENGE